MQKKVDGSHLSQVSDRADDIKKALIDTIENMNDQEVEVMRSAIDSVKGSKRSRQVKKGLKVTKTMERIKEPPLEEVPEEKKEEAESSIAAKEEEASELADKVLDLPEKPSKAAVPSTKSKSSRKSFRSSTSSKYISELESQIEDERKEREKLKKEVEEMKKISEQLMKQIQSSKKEESQDSPN
mmetsp:Transcript_19526/g.19194  ORF Transcript_19526/g.19194 Transcript_19526/m.19194 type:complete len:184 (-) Transcript_19526:150-701(-)